MDWMPEAKRRQAKAMFERGMGYKAVARLLELNVYTVRDWGREFKAGKFRVSDTELGDAATVVDLREDQILDLRRQGFDDRTIALRIGLSLQTVRRYLKRSLMKELTGPKEPCGYDAGRNGGVLHCGIDKQRGAL